VAHLHQRLFAPVQRPSHLPPESIVRQRDVLRETTTTATSRVQLREALADEHPQAGAADISSASWSIRWC
jgi:hypothetical protein